MIGLALDRRSATPLVLQAEVAECGLACLAMVAAHHGLVLDLRTLRARVGASPRGANLVLLAGMAERLGLRSRALRVELDELSAVRTPAILHWNLHHFVVLERLRGDCAKLLDPARGARTVTRAELDRGFSGVVLELEPSVEFRPERSAQRFSVRDLLAGATGLRATLLRLLTVSLAVQLLALTAPFAMQLVIDEVLVAHDAALLSAVVAGFGLLLVTQVALGTARSLAVTAMATRLGRALHIGLFDHLLSLPQAYFAIRHSGDIAGRFASLDAIQRTLTMSFVEGVIDGMLGAVALVMLWVYSPTLAAVACSAMLAYLLCRWAWYGSLRRATEEQIHHGALRQSHLLESMRVVPTLRVYGGEQGRVAHQDDLNCNALNAGLRAAHLGIGAQTANSLLFGVENLAMLWLGASAVLAGQMTVGMLMAFASFKATFTGRVSGLVDRWFEYRMLTLHAERVGGIALEPPLPRSDAGVHAGEAAAAVEIDALGFRYPGGRWVLRGVTTRVAPGRCLAVVGPSGCGKSTLAKLVLGLLEANEGRVVMGGRVVSPALVGEPWHGVTAVLQDDALLAGTVAENIALHRAAPDLPQIEHAARLAGIHDEIMAMPMRYDTLLGELGGLLSGGQRQRVLLARALYFEPRVLVLDEATSHLDPARERSVVDNLRGLPMTRIVIAHRSETIRLADEVLQLGANQEAKGFDMRAWGSQV